MEEDPPEVGAALYEARLSLSEKALRLFVQCFWHLCWGLGFRVGVVFSV